MAAMESFVVRVRSPDDESSRERLRGVVRHVASGTELAFSHADSLVAFLRRHTEAVGISGLESERRT
jgi:hypothetical protein